ncbi:MAG: response regulator transcription factor [bacterium]
MRILIVEDEAHVAHLIRKGLKEAGHVSDVATDTDDGDYLVGVNDYDIILLDWLLPGKSGLEMCREWREQGLHTPVIMLTCKDRTSDISSALDNGADDYITKPFSFTELLARMRAVLRRAQKTADTDLKLDDLMVNFGRREVIRGGRKLFLSSREFSLLEYLLRNAGKVVTKTEISEHVWGVLFDTNTNIVEVYVSHLRNKLNCGSQRPLIHTVRGVGYMMKMLDS